MLFTTIQPTTGCGCSTSSHANTICPNCHENGLLVKAITVKSQLKKECLHTMKTSINDFIFCSNPQCDTVYYSNDASEVFFQKDVKSKVTMKNNDPKTPLCYCQKLLKENVLKMINEGEKDVVSKIKSIIASGKSFCEKSNPKGVCCTEDIKNFLSDFSIRWDTPKKSLFSITPPSQCC